MVGETDGNEAVSRAGELCKCWKSWWRRRRQGRDAGHLGAFRAGGHLGRRKGEAWMMRATEGVQDEGIGEDLCTAVGDVLVTDDAIGYEIAVTTSFVEVDHSCREKGIK